MEIHSLESIIAEHPSFAGLQPQHLATITGCASNMRFMPGEEIFRDGTEANHFYMIRHGDAAVRIYVPGKDYKTVSTVHAGDVLGWSWLFPPYRWQFDAQAVSAVRAVVFDGRCLRTKCEADHELGYQLMQRFVQIMLKRWNATLLQLLDVYGEPV